LTEGFEFPLFKSTPITPHLNDRVFQPRNLTLDNVTPNFKYLIWDYLYLIHIAKQI